MNKTELQSYRATELQSYSEKYWPSKGTPSILHKKLGDPRRVDNAYNLLDNFLEL
ncbi:unnamed protein product [Acidithrix sp. C25]|nr:unnamed protein product [Acidithrix sp. C25]